MDPDPGCPKTCRSCRSGSGFPTMFQIQSNCSGSATLKYCRIAFPSHLNSLVFLCFLNSARLAGSSSRLVPAESPHPVLAPPAPAPPPSSFSLVNLAFSSLRFRSTFSLGKELIVNFFVVLNESGPPNRLFAESDQYPRPDF
jgi:hypothetical protein